MEEQNFRLFSLNANGMSIDKVTKLEQVRDFDLFFIQETHNGLTDTITEKLERELDCVIIRNDYIGTDSGEGVATLIKNKPGMKWDRIEEGDFFRGRLLHIRIGQNHYINVYVPARLIKKKAFARKLRLFGKIFRGKTNYWRRL
jgi:exonuclease III